MSVFYGRTSVIWLDFYDTSYFIKFVILSVFYVKFMMVNSIIGLDSYTDHQLMVWYVHNYIVRIVTWYTELY